VAVKDPIPFPPASSWLSAIFDLLGPTELTADLESPDNAGKTSMGKRSISDVFLFLQVLFFATAVPFLLRLKLSRVEVLLEPRISSPPERDRVEQITEYVEMAMRQGRPLVRPGCLTRGVTRYYFLRRDGMDVSLCFGMGQVDGEFVGHCWLVKDGVPFMETWDPRPLYSEMYRLSGSNRRSSTPARKNELEQSRS
jgi:hypothetical protein